MLITFPSFVSTTCPGVCKDRLADTFAQFVARATCTATRFGPDVVEGRWFDHLPSTLAFRSDSEADFWRLLAATSF